MTEPILARPKAASRTKLFVNVVLFALLVLLGSQIIDPRISKRVFASAVAFTGIISGVIPGVGREHPRLARWLVLASAGSVGLTVGLLIRMIMQGFHAG